MAEKLVPTKIHLLGNGRHEEAVAAGAITPGMLLKASSTLDDANPPKSKVVAHDVAGGYAEAMFAVEDALQGRTIADAYSSGELVQIVMAEKGDVVLAWLNSGENVAAGDFLVSNGDGMLQKLAGSELPVAVSLQTMNLSDSNDPDTRIRVRIL